MDLLSHTLVGLTVSQLDGVRELGPAATLTLVVASNFPDIDVFSRLRGSSAYLANHRGATHSVIALPVESGLLAFLIHAWPPAQALGFPLLFGLCLLGMGLHVAMDILTPFGTRVGLPFSRKWITVSSFPVFEPFLLVSTLLLLALSFFFPDYAGRFAKSVLGLWALTLFLYAFHKYRLHRKFLAPNQKKEVRIETFPVPGIPFLWLCVMENRRCLRTFLINAWSGRRRRLKVYRKHPISREINKSATGRLFLKHAHFPWVESKNLAGGGRLHRLRDLRYDYPFRRFFFCGELRFDKKGVLVHEKFRL